MATYVNDLRLTELATGEGSGTWGTTTNTNLELIGEALGYGTQNCFATDADATTTVADGASDPARSLYFKVTSSATLTATRVLTIAPNTVSRVMFIENATTGSQSITISQGSGANVTIATGKTAVVYLDGAGSGAAVVDALALVDPGVTDTLAEVLVAGNATGGTDIAVGTGDDITFADNSKAIFGAGSDLQIGHDGSVSFITDSGTGDLYIQGSSAIRLTNPAGNESFAVFNDNGAVSLYYDNGVSLSTTATGIDVTGTVTADGLTLGADDKIQFGSSDITGLYRTNSGNDLTLQHWGNASVLIDSDNNDSGTRSFLIGSNSQDRSTATSIAKFEDGGDISFYEDTGTTAKLFWDASAESLGIGTASPTRELEVTGTGNVYVKVTAPTATDSTALELANTGETWTIANDDTNSDALEFRTTGGTHLTVDTSGNVGIGTISPDSVLHLFGNTSAANIPRIKIEASGWSNDCRIERSSGSDGFYITNNYDTSASSADNSGAGTAGLQLARGFAAIHTGASGAFEEALRIDSSGNTTFKANNSAVGPIVTLENTATAVNGQAWGSIHFDSNDTSTSASGTRASIVGTSTSFNGDGNLDFYTAPDNGTNTFAMRIDSSGDVSIGDVSAEGAKLHIRTSNATTYNAASASGGDGVNLIVHNDNATANTTAGVILRTQVSGSFADARINNIGVSQNNSAMTFHTEGSGTVAERMRIDSSGSLLVGTTSFPSGTATTGSGFGWTSSGYKVQNYDNAGSIAMNFLNATSYVSGTVNFMTFRVNGSTKGSITSNGTTTAYNTSSDQRLKENIVDAPSASDDIDAIQVRSFDWKADGSHQKYGMVAQELVTVAPEAVSQPEDPEEMMGVDYSKLVPMMLKEIQQLRARVAQLEGAN